MAEQNFVFEMVDGRPMPRIPRDQVIDGKRFLNETQCAEKFGHDDEHWKREWIAVLEAYLTTSGEPETPVLVPDLTPPEQRLNDDIIRRVRFPKLSDDHWAYVKAECASRRINPSLVWVKLEKSEDDPEIVEPKIIYTIAAVRAIAQRTGRRRVEGSPEFSGADEVFRPGPWVDESRPPYAARVTVVDSDGVPHVGIAYWKFCAQLKRDEKGNYVPVRCWANGGPHMLGKCASVAAHRIGWPMECGGLYTGDEMHVSKADETPLDEPPKEKTSETANGVLEALEIVTRPAAPMLYDDPKKAWEFVDETTPESRTRLELDLLEVGVTPLDKSKAVVDLFKTQLPRLFSNHFQAFAATVLRTVRNNPGFYGVT